MAGKVLVSLNVLGIDLKKEEVDAVLANEANQFELKQRWLISFFQLENSSELIKNVLIRYAEADQLMARISVGANQADIYDRLINTLVSAKRCYSNAEYIACIELCALHGEMLANYLCITEKGLLEKAFCQILNALKNIWRLFLANTRNALRQHPTAFVVFFKDSGIGSLAL